MDLRYSEADDEFRARARAWLRTHVPRSSRPPRGRVAADFDRAWQRKLYEHGWAVPLGQPFPMPSAPPPDDSAAVAARIRQLLGLTA